MGVSDVLLRYEDGEMTQINIFFPVWWEWMILIGSSGIGAYPGFSRGLAQKWQGAAGLGWRISWHKNEFSVLRSL